MKAMYRQKGENINYKNTTTTVIDANTVMILGTRIGVASAPIFPGEIGSVVMEGVFEGKKTSTNEIAAGTDVYFDGEGFTEEPTGNTNAGYAAETTGASETVIFFKLRG